MPGRNCRCRNIVSVEIDPEANAVYIHLKKGNVDNSEPLADNITIDVDKEGETTGIKILLPEKDSRTQEFIYKAF
ncbi:MAG: DUF2283 domain-containing protein [ANME-2 cluster archaeon]|nr:DUF2283 domain-containing protein [ANME-2 cluster archaeon]